MGVIELRCAADASWALRKELRRKYPGAVIWGGISVRMPHHILVKATSPIEVPDTYEWDGFVYSVDFCYYGELDDNCEVYQDTSTCSTTYEGESRRSRVGPVHADGRLPGTGHSEAGFSWAEDSDTSGIRSTGETEEWVSFEEEYHSLEQPWDY